MGIGDYPAMKRTPLVVLTLASVASVLHSQPQTTGKPSNASIEVAGVKLQLGMTKPTVAERLVGTQTTKVDENSWIVENAGVVRFKNGRLVYANRSWMGDGRDQIDAVFKAVDSVNRQGLRVCRVSADTPLGGTSSQAKDGEDRNLGISSERVLINCGERTILIVKTKLPTEQNVDVSEAIGVWEGN